MAIRFSKVNLKTDTGQTAEFLCPGIPRHAVDFHGAAAYEDLVQSNPAAKSIEASVTTYLYGAGEVFEANIYEVTAYTLRGPEFLSHPDVHQVGESGFTVIPEHLLVGRITYNNGEVQDFTDGAEFLATVKDELDYWPSNGMDLKVLNGDPQLRKAVDDLIYGLTGEENPNPPEYYESPTEAMEMEEIP